MAEPQKKVTINVVFFIKQIVELERYHKKNQPILLKEAARRYLDFLREHYQSEGSGTWASLAQKTINLKKWRVKKGYGRAENIKRPLFETGTLYDSMGVRVRGKFVYVGFVRNKEHPRGGSTGELARMHNYGHESSDGNIPQREILVAPDSRTLRQMRDDVIRNYNKQIRKNRNNKK